MRRVMIAIGMTLALVAGSASPAFAAYRSYETGNRYGHSIGYIVWKGKTIRVDALRFRTDCVTNGEPIGKSYLYLSFQEKVGKKWKKRNKQIASQKTCKNRGKFSVKTKVKGKYRAAAVTFCTDADVWRCGKPG